MRCCFKPFCHDQHLPTTFHPKKNDNMSLHFLSVYSQPLQRKNLKWRYKALKNILPETTVDLRKTEPTCAHTSDWRPPLEVSGLWSLRVCFREPYIFPSPSCDKNDSTLSSREPTSPKFSKSSCIKIKIEKVKKWRQKDKTHWAMLNFDFHEISPPAY